MVWVRNAKQLKGLAIIGARVAPSTGEAGGASPSMLAALVLELGKLREGQCSLWLVLEAGGET